jgi:hypothetical protein
VNAMIFVGILTNIFFGVYYGAMVAVATVVLRYARRTRHEGLVRTSRDQYPAIRAWCITLLVVITVVMWIWPFQYFTYLWYIVRTNNLEFTISSLLLALVKPLAALLTAVAGVRLYERSRAIRAPEEAGFQS